MTRISVMCETTAKAPVSYTHLDVYKRQTGTIVSRLSTMVRCAFFNASTNCVASTRLSVSDEYDFTCTTRPARVVIAANPSSCLLLKRRGAIAASSLRLEAVRFAAFVSSSAARSFAVDDSVLANCASRSVFESKVSLKVAIRPSAFDTKASHNPSPMTPNMMSIQPIMAMHLKNDLCVPSVGILHVDTASASSNKTPIATAAVQKSNQKKYSPLRAANSFLIDSSRRSTMLGGTGKNEDEIETKELEIMLTIIFIVGVLCAVLRMVTYIRRRY